ncbi:C39 family peptidase [Caenimonas terrae]|uniref:C39 family peptidase n=1 Tax=Caenimonas terrae TaxID=696074 RepID=A0ABW0N9K6_9BURK
MFRRLSPPTFRSFLAALALAALALPGQAEEVCGTPNGDGVSICSAGLPAGSAERLVVAQEQPQWCWAAAISMIFAHHGYAVRQEDIVKDGYGAVVDMPAPSGQAMTRALSKAWVDGRHRPFQGHAVATDAYANRFQVSEHKVVAELADGNPLLLGAMQHAVVLVSLTYEKSRRGNVRILGGTVIDPQPGKGLRPLLAGEMKPTYVAAVEMMAEGQELAIADATANASSLH